MLVGATVSILLQPSCLIKYGDARNDNDVPFNKIGPNVSGFDELLYKVVLLLIISPMSIVALLRPPKYRRKSYRV